MDLMAAMGRTEAMAPMEATDRTAATEAGSKVASEAPIEGADGTGRAADNGVEAPRAELDVVDALERQHQANHGAWKQHSAGGLRRKLGRRDALGIGRRPRGHHL